MEAVLFKLNQLLSSRYGKALELRLLIDLSKLSDASATLVSGNDLYIPIMVQQQFLGTAVVPHGWELSEENRTSLTQLVRMVLEPKLYSEFLERRESNLRSVQLLEFPSTNLSLLGEDNSFERETSFANNATPSTTPLIHLQGKQNQIMKKVALQIHDFSGRWVFVPFEDVQNDLDSVTELCNLGGITLFVKDVENLSAKYQDLLASYLSLPRSLEEPLILTSSLIPVSELNSFISNPGLLEDIQAVHLAVDRTPLNSSALRDVVELIFYKDNSQDLH